MKKTTAFVITILLLPLCLSAADFGLLLDQNFGLTGGVTGTKPVADYQVAVIPRISGLLGDPANQRFGEFIATAGITVGYENELYCVPELLHTELSFYFDTAKISFGRMQYSSPFAYIADGFFDGFQFAYNSPLGTFNAGIWYTGLLYKKKANISITIEDEISYFGAVDYGDFAGTYFASKRMVQAIGWEHPALAQLFRTKLAVITQLDLNGRDDYLNSQYFTAKIGVPVNEFMFELGGAFEFMETAAKAGGAFNIGLAGELGVFWILPANFPSRLSFIGSIFSGHTENDSLAAFVPITDKSCGNILEAKPSGISVLSLDYTARLHKTVLLGLTSSYFIRNDKGTYVKYPVDLTDSGGFFLGNEFYAGAIWTPVSDLQINFGGGVFLPAMGNAEPERDPMWRIKLAAVLAIF